MVLREAKVPRVQAAAAWVVTSREPSPRCQQACSSMWAVPVLAVLVRLVDSTVAAMQALDMVMRGLVAEPQTFELQLL